MSIPSRTFNKELSRLTQFPSLVHTDDLYFRRCMSALVCVLCVSAHSLVVLLDACKRSKEFCDMREQGRGGWVV